jgi:hypothetical protein
MGLASRRVVRLRFFSLLCWLPAAQRPTTKPCPPSAKRSETFSVSRVKDSKKEQQQAKEQIKTTM